MCTKLDIYVVIVICDVRSQVIFQLSLSRTYAYISTNGKHHLAFFKLIASNRRTTDVHLHSLRHVCINIRSNMVFFLLLEYGYEDIC